MVQNKRKLELCIIYTASRHGGSKHRAYFFIKNMKEDEPMLTNKQSYLKLLFSEFRFVVADKGQILLSNEALTKAMTLNTNIESLGFTFSAKDIVEVISTMENPEEIYEAINSYVSVVKAKPMYPDFPSQVMEMDEAQYRFDQLMHYDSTYGAMLRASLLQLAMGLTMGLDTEYEIGELPSEYEMSGSLPSEYKISKGWLPSVEDTKKTMEDKTLLKAKVLEIIPSEKMYTLPVRRILSKRERMSSSDELIIRYAIDNYRGAMADLIPEKIEFKENILILVDNICSMENDSKKKELLTAVCQHTGDVLRCIEYRLQKSHYHLSRPEKRLWVAVLEQYSEIDLECNLMLSNKKASGNIRLLQFIDYNRYSHSRKHRDVVARFRNGDLQSWEGKLKKLNDKDVHAGLRFAATHPGNLVRMVTWFLRLGCSQEEIKTALAENASSLSSQTLVDLLDKFLNQYQTGYDSDGHPSSDIDEERTKEHERTAEVLKYVLAAKCKTLDTPLSMPVEYEEEIEGENVVKKVVQTRPKKVFIDEECFDWNNSRILGNNKSIEGGYLRKGLKIKIPEDVKNVRFFTYWNDKKCVDVDLHAYMRDSNSPGVKHVGWNGDFRQSGVVMSGDITHSDAAEYIDVDIEKAAASGIDRIQLCVHLFNGKENLGAIDECYVGCLAVSDLGKKVKLYNPKNCFFASDLNAKVGGEIYGVVNPGERTLELCCEEYSPYEDTHLRSMAASHKVRFSLRDYIEMLVKEQGAQLVVNRAEADVVLKIQKSESDSENSLTDVNFWLDAKSRVE